MKNSTKDRFTKFSVLKLLQNEYLEFTRWNPQDARAIDFGLATYVGNLWNRSRERIWGLLNGPAGSGKSLMLRTLGQWFWSVEVDTLTPTALASGFGLATGGPDVSLLPQLDNKILLIKDLSSIVGLHPSASATIMGDLRALFDEEGFNRATGVGQVQHDSHFGILGACTETFDDFLANQSALGERFVQLRMGTHVALGPPHLRDERTRWVRKQEKHLPGFLTHIRKLRGKYLAPLIKDLGNLKDDIEITWPEEHDIVFDILCDVITRLRTRPSGFKIQTPEASTRIGKQLQNLAESRAVLDGRTHIDESDMEFIAVVAHDCVHPDLMLAMDAFWGGSSQTARLGLRPQFLVDVGIPAGFVKKIIRQWQGISLIERKPTDPNRYRISGSDLERIEKCKILKNTRGEEYDWSKLTDVTGLETRSERRGAESENDDDQLRIVG